MPDLSAEAALATIVAAALNCDGTQTVYWWACIGPLSAGAGGTHSVPANAYAIQIWPGTPFDVTAANLIVTNPVGLSSPEQTNLVTAAQIAPVLPVVVVTP